VIPTQGACLHDAVGQGIWLCVSQELDFYAKLYEARLDTTVELLRMSTRLLDTTLTRRPNPATRRDHTKVAVWVVHTPTWQGGLFEKRAEKRVLPKQKNER
jgi:hypothetical protein